MTAQSRIGVAPSLVRQRDDSLDMARGLIVALMALDHVRMYFTAAQFDPVDIERTTLAIFLTRWATHLCAPGFFFLAGFGAALFASQAGKTAAARFLLVRGAMLMMFEIVLFGFAWSFHPGFWWFGVIWSLGAAMVCMAALLWLPRSLLFAAAALFTLLHNSLWPGSAPSVDALLYGSGMTALPLAGARIVVFPLLPWLALMALGYCAAPLLRVEADPRGSRLLAVGAAAIAAFVVLRVVGIGEPAGGPFDPAAAGDRALISFLNVEKYPPSLQYSLATLGLTLLFVGLLRRWSSAQGSAPMRALLVFGRVPFFFYLLHLYLIHAAALLAAIALGWPTDYLFWTDGPKLIPPDGYGFGIVAVYAAWLVILAVLLPLCAWYWKRKRSSTSWLLKLF